MDEKKTPKKHRKKKVEYYCEKCDFLSSNKKDYNRHLKTKKHVWCGKKTPKTAFVEFECVYCDKKYKTKSGLRKHQKKCNALLNSLVEPLDPNPKNPKNTKLKTEKKSLEMKKKEIEEKEELMMKMIEQQKEVIFSRF